MTGFPKISTSSLPPELQQFLHRLLDQAMESQQAAFGDLQLYNREDDVLDMVIHRNLPVTFVDRFRRFNPTESQTVCARAFRSGAPVFVGDVRKDPPFAAYLDVADSVGFRGVYSIPLILDGQVVGVMSTLFSQPRDFPPSSLGAVQHSLDQRQGLLREYLK